METKVANVRVRASGTLGGNLCFAEPHSDPATLLIALGAKAHVQGKAGARTVAIDKLITGAYETSLARRRTSRRRRDSTAGKIAARRLSQIPTQRTPDAGPGARPRSRRRQHQKSLAPSSAASARCRPSPTKPTACSPARETQVEKQLGDAAEALAQAADPVDDLEGSADYKRHLIGVFLRRAFTKALS